MFNDVNNRIYEIIDIVGTAFDNANVLDITNVGDIWLRHICLI